MVEAPILFGQLVLHLAGYTREPCAPGLELVTLEIGIENRASGLGDARQPPTAELGDAQGRTYALASEVAWSEPLQPATSTPARLAFEVPLDATGLELALARGTEDEVLVPLG